VFQLRRAAVIGERGSRPESDASEAFAVYQSSEKQMHTATAEIAKT
jgi:hypothetical protein